MALAALVDFRVDPADQAAWVASLDLVGFQAARVAQVEAVLAVLQDAQADFRGREVEAHRRAQGARVTAKSTNQAFAENQTNRKRQSATHGVLGCLFLWNHEGFLSFHSIALLVGSGRSTVSLRNLPKPIGWA